MSTKHALGMNKYNEEFNSLFPLITEDDWDVVSSMNRSLLQILVGKPEGRGNLRRPRHRQQNDNMKMYF
jgi:hypothetical protein